MNEFNADTEMDACVMTISRAQSFVLLPNVIALKGY